jgi:hypothetical protein
VLVSPSAAFSVDALLSLKETVTQKFSPVLGRFSFKIDKFPKG